ncbi:MAG: phosphoribosylanthranilate isomerase [Muribaculaceae bacterium]|nr:phosphoribosylanthranilate isomerase [Muribaculaceae bacterium]
MKIKVCGMREALNVAEIGKEHPDYMGFIFFPPSPRDCSEMNPDVLKNLPEGVEPVAVTVNMKPESVIQLVERYGFRTVQLHGDESPADCRILQEKGLNVFKAIGIKGEESLKRFSDYQDYIDMFVFDTSGASRGGTGRKFDWNLLHGYTGETPFLLSGGIGPEDMELVKGIRHNSFAGIDLNSRFEISPAKKDVDLIRKFFKEIRK